jgi:hypothetical protein
MSYQVKSGLYQIPIVDFGKQLQGRGWNVAEHSAFGGNSGGHADNSYHNYDEAIDITWKNNQYGDFDPSGKIGWADWTDQLGGRLKGAGPEVLHRSNDPNHGTHVHLAAKNGVLQLTAGQMNDFGFMMDGKPIVAQPGEENRATAKKKAQDYSNMSKSQMNSSYDAMRDKPNASKEGMKMHEAYFNKPKTVLS